MSIVYGSSGVYLIGRCLEDTGVCVHANELSRHYNYNACTWTSLNKQEFMKYNVTDTQPTVLSLFNRNI